MLWGGGIVVVVMDGRVGMLSVCRLEVERCMVGWWVWRLVLGLLYL